MELSFYLWLMKTDYIALFKKHIEHVPWGNYISIHPTIWSKHSVLQGFTNSRCQLTWVTRFCMLAPNICRSWVWNLLLVTLMTPGILRLLLCYCNICGPFHSFHGHVQNATIPCHAQELLPFLSVMYFFLPPISTNHSSILSHFILPSISWSTSQSFVPRFIYNTLLGILFSSILCTCPNQRNLYNLIVPCYSRFFLPLHKFLYWLLSSNFLFHCHILDLKFFYKISFQKCSFAFYLWTSGVVYCQNILWHN